MPHNNDGNLVIVYENCEYVVVKPKAVIGIYLNKVADRIMYCPSSNIKTPEYKPTLNVASMDLDISDPSDFSTSDFFSKDFTEGEKAVELLRNRRDITTIKFDGVEYSVEWYYPENSGTSMEYSNAYQDPTGESTTHDGKKHIHIRINANDRPQPEYMRGLVDGDKLYVAEYENSNTFTRCFILDWAYMGRFHVAVSCIHDSDRDELCRVYYREIIKPTYPENDTRLDKDTIVIGRSDNWFKFKSCVLGKWNLVHYPADGELGERELIEVTDHCALDAKFPVFKKVKTIEAPMKTILAHQVKEVQDEIDRETFKDMVEMAKGEKK